MKTAFLTLVIFLTFISCKDKSYSKYKAYNPVYMDLETFRQSVKFESPRIPLKQGNIYKKDQYLLLVEPNEGIHVFDNSSPNSPKNLGFLKIMGCSNVSMKGNYLYANNLMDLVVVDFQNPLSPIETSRMNDVFPNNFIYKYIYKNEDYTHKYPIKNIETGKGIVVDWEVIDVVEEKNQQSGGCYPVTNYGNDALMNESTSNFTSNFSSGAGVSGSITKFTIVGDYLYTYENHNLTSINIQNPTNPIINSTLFISNSVETLFPFENNIFMGTTTGMLIYSLANPSSPSYTSVINHAKACDPVVAEGNYCYVTTRSGGFCGGTSNQLDVIDISSLQSPVLKISFQMVNPHGLGIDGDNLFICDGSAGLKVFDATNPLTCGNNLVKAYSELNATDVILDNKIAILIAEDGLYQYDYSDLNNIVFLSKISINN